MPAGANSDVGGDFPPPTKTTNDIYKYEYMGANFVCCLRKAENLPSDALSRLTRGGGGNMHKEVLDEANDG